jgi:ABC-2 type transport system permease protein
MTGFSQHLAASLRLYFRNTMALIYGYAFPLIFLIAFYVLYRYERVPLARHMGELLTIAVLGGACFGLPTTLVSERERGVWRRFRLTPVPTRTLVVGTMIARFAILITAGLLQLALALAIGMPWPRHPLELLFAFSLVAFAFLGLGLVIATLADNVPAVQALGQCIFLPMLIIGGVAVQLSALPDWAQHISAFFPGRYAVEALQACVTGNGLGEAPFNVLALLVIGAAACLAGARMFRWDAQQRFIARDGKGWLAVALLAWVAVGAMAEMSGRVLVTPPSAQAARVQTPAPPSVAAPPPSAPAASPVEPPSIEPEQPAPAEAPASPATSKQPAAAPVETPVPMTEPPGGEPKGAVPPAEAPRAPAAEGPVAPEDRPKRWQDVTVALIEREIIFDRLPPDNGVVTPIAPLFEEPDPDVAEELEIIRAQLPAWEPGRIADPVQRIRNLLFVAAVPDVYQLPIESYVPILVFAHLEQEVPKDDLVKLLFWVAVHPTEGSDAAVDQLQAFGLGNGPSDILEVRNRAAYYAVKLLGRLLGKRPIR